MWADLFTICFGWTNNTWADLFISYGMVQPNVSIYSDHLLLNRACHI